MILEKSSLLLFSLAVIGLVLVVGISPNRDQIAPNDPAVTAQANAMPNQGWAPLTVFFSAFGSRSQNEQIVKYEWDLDGNGKPDFDSTNQGGYAKYLYSKPGDYTITLRVTDAQGRSSTGQVVVSVQHPASSSVDYWTVFDDTQVRRIELALRQADWDRMWAQVEAKVQVPADAMIFGKRVEDVGLKMRGQFSLRESRLKKPWEIDTDVFVDGQEFYNLRQLILLNNLFDPSLLREKLAYDMMRFAGVPASHATFVDLWFDFTDDTSASFFWGVYTLVERVDAKFVANRFGPESKGGNLYKASHALRGPMDLIYYGEYIEDYPTQNGQYAYGKLNNEQEGDYSDIVNLCRVIDGTEYPDEESFTTAIETAINVDTFLRYMAVNVLLGNWDIYPNTGNNYILFNNRVNGRFEWIPWDLTWGESVQAPVFQTPDIRIVQRAPLYDKVFQIERYRYKFAAYLDLLLRYWFNEENIASRASTLYQMIAPHIAQSTGDKMFYGAQAMIPAETVKDPWKPLVDYTRSRKIYVLQVLQSEGLR